MRHYERCKDCKQRIQELLGELCGDVRRNYNLDMPAKLDDYKADSIYDFLAIIYKKLQDHRGYSNFVKAKKLSPDRDEQRAWYDSLRDFSALIRNSLPTVRLYSKDTIWCLMNAKNAHDVKKFSEFLDQSISDSYHTRAGVDKK